MFPADAGNLVFPVIAAGMVTLSIAVVVVRNPVLATFLLITSFLPTAGLYILLHAPLAGVFQVLVYAGAILVLFTFVVMMVNPVPGALVAATGEEASGIRHFFLSLVFCVVVSAGTAFGVSRALSIESETPVISQEFGGMRSIGRMMFASAQNNPLTVSFELLSYLILAGMVIALNLTLSKKKGGQR